MGVFRDLTGDYATGLRVLTVAFVLGGLLALRVRVKQTAVTVAAVDSITPPGAVPEQP